MPTSKNSLLDHFKLLRSAVAAHGLEAIMGISDFSVLLRRDSLHAVLHPQFLASRDGARRYAPTLTNDAIMFAGWLPYRNKRWPIASDKLAFKAFARSVGLRTPAYATDLSEPMENAVVKRALSSFGEQVLGPLRTSDDHALDVGAGEYFERFVHGTIMKIWFWNDRAVCAELDKMPRITGDGATTAATLVARRIASKGSASAAEIATAQAHADTMLRFYGLDGASVLAHGKKVTIDFRYGSLLMRPANRTVVDFRQAPAAELAGQLAVIGSKVFQAIPAGIRAGTLWTADAILDKEQRIWLLEINSNPTVHPLAYGPIVASLIAAQTGRRGPQPIPAVAPPTTVH